MLSIIIPTLNEEKYLPKLLDSIKEQDFNDYEIIIADNNSKDKTRQIAKSYGAKVVKGGLPAKARNLGAAAAKGDLLLFLDSDVILSNNALKKAIYNFKKKKLTIALFSMRANSKNPVDKLLYSGAALFLKIFHRLRPLGAGCGGILVKKNLHEKIKGFDETRRFGEDTHYIAKAAKLGKYRILNPRLYVSTRRLRTEGRLRSCLKYVKSTIYDIIGKDTSNIDYDFGHYKK